LAAGRFGLLTLSGIVSCSRPFIVV